MDEVLIVDAGSQYTHLLLRRILEMGVKARIVQDVNNVQTNNIKGIIISGGPNSVYKTPLNLDEKIFSLAYQF